MRRKRRPDEKKATIMLEEATHLLRSAPAELYLVMCVGNVPFVLGFLYFWADMSRGATAYLNAPQAALTLALLFMWMKGCQAYFANGLRDLLLGQQRQGWGPRRWMRTLLVQAALQGSSLFVLPVASIVAMPFGWTYAFYRNLSVFGNGKEPGLGPVINISWQQATYDASQNHMAIFILSTFGLFVYINAIGALLIGPFLLKTLLGIETVFAKVGVNALNTTLLIVAWGGSYLIMEPLINAFYTLRCFYGESRRTGHDLMAELDAAAPGDEARPKAPARATVAIITATVLLGLIAGNAWADANTAATTAHESGQPSQRILERASHMDQAINKTLEGRKYQWRMPRLDEPEIEGQEPGLITKFFVAVGQRLRSWGRSAWHAIKSFFEWIADILPDISPGARVKHDKGWGISPDLLVLILLLLTAAAGGLLAYRILRQRSSEAGEVQEAVIEYKTPDLESEDVTASDLPLNGWLATAADLLIKGDRRLAMRALFLACLAMLAEAGLISIAGFKSNRDYMRELERHAHALPGLMQAMARNVGIFESIWYGRHEVTSEIIETFNENQDKVFSIAGQ